MLLDYPPSPFPHAETCLDRMLFFFFKLHCRNNLVLSQFLICARVRLVYSILFATYHNESATLKQLVLVVWREENKTNCQSLVQFRDLLHVLKDGFKVTVPPLFFKYVKNWCQHNNKSTLPKNIYSLRITTNCWNPTCTALGLLLPDYKCPFLLNYNSLIKVGWGGGCGMDIKKTTVLPLPLPVVSFIVCKIIQK